MEFFAQRGEFPPAGLFSSGHLIMLGCCSVAFAIAVYFIIKRPAPKPYCTLRIVSIVILVLEIIKTMWGLSAGRYDEWYEYLPIWFCSLFIPVSLFAGFAKGKIQHLAMSFLYYGGLIGECTYLAFPTTSIGRYPFWHFITFHSMFYHTVMLVIAIYVVRNRLIEPSSKDRRGYVLLVIGACVLAYVVNEQLGTNYMFLAKPASNNALLQLALALTGPLYPVAVTLWQAYVSYFMAGWFYRKCLKGISDIS